LSGASIYEGRANTGDKLQRPRRLAIADFVSFISLFCGTFATYRSLASWHVAFEVPGAALAEAK
jgi:hypothetical protein